MGDPQIHARALGRTLADGGETPQPKPNPWVEWSGGVNNHLAALDARLDYHGTAFEAIERVFENYQKRIAKLEARVAELLAKPAARSVEHIRDSAGQVIRSVVIDG